MVLLPEPAIFGFPHNSKRPKKTRLQDAPKKRCTKAVWADGTDTRSLIRRNNVAVTPLPVTINCDTQPGSAIQSRRGLVGPCKLRLFRPRSKKPVTARVSVASVASIPVVRPLIRPRQDPK